MTDQPPADPTANFTRDEVQAALDIFDVEKTGRISATTENLRAFYDALGFENTPLTGLQVSLFFITFF